MASKKKPANFKVTKYDNPFTKKEFPAFRRGFLMSIIFS